MHLNARSSYINKILELHLVDEFLKHETGQNIVLYTWLSQAIVNDQNQSSAAALCSVKTRIWPLPCAHYNTQMPFTVINTWKPSQKSLCFGTKRKNPAELVFNALPRKCNRNDIVICNKWSHMSKFSHQVFSVIFPILHRSLAAESTTHFSKEDIPSKHPSSARLWSAGCKL